MTVLFHEYLIGREFGSQVLSVERLQKWLRDQHLEPLTISALDGYKFVQVEHLLSNIEAATTQRTADALASFEGDAENAPGWQFGAKANLAWRERIRGAVKARELQLLDYATLLPVDTDTTTADGKAPPWWRTEHDIMDMAQTIGAKMESQHKSTSNSEIAKEIAARIRDIESHKHSDRRTPDSDTVRGVLTGWRYKNRDK